MYTKLFGVLFIDGVEQTNTNLEIGVFDQNDICRDTRVPKQTPAALGGRFMYSFQIKGNDGDTYHFKVYDQENEVELNVVDDFEDVITYQGNYTYQYNGANTNARNCYPLNFVSVGGQTFEKTITGYGEDETGKAGYYFIASPINVNPENITDMTYEGDDKVNYDLFYFDQAQAGSEWQNYKVNNFTLEAGTGYLYANKNTVTLSVSGTPSEEEIVTVTLNKTGNGPWAGWTLVGNPFGTNAFFDRPGYIMDGAGYVRKNANDAIEVWQGILVQTDEDGQTLTITKDGSKSPNLAINVTDGNNLVDGASICFGNGHNLSKITFRDNDSKLYLTQENKDYAVVYSEAQGEMPVSFKAEKSGTYNLSFTAENTNFDYLHLIDNKTGNDVDLLKTQSYSFDAQANQSNRFKLVYSASDNSTDNFAFLSNGNIIIPGIEGEATLQVIDVTGRVLSSETFSGSYNKAINAAQGVYVLRLTNGTNTMTQKIVVK